MNVIRNVNSRKRSHWLRLPLHVYLSYLLVATFLFTGISFSKYATTVSVQDDARVAAFSVSVDGEAAAALVLDVSNEVQTSNSYSFSVSAIQRFWWQMW